MQSLAGMEAYVVCSSVLSAPTATSAPIHAPAPAPEHVAEHADNHAGALVTLPAHRDENTASEHHLGRAGRQPMSDGFVTATATSRALYKEPGASALASFDSSAPDQPEQLSFPASLVLALLHLASLFLWRLFQLFISSFHLLFPDWTMAPNPNECSVMLQSSTEGDEHVAKQMPIQVRIVMTSSDDSSDGEHFFDASSEVPYSSESDLALSSAKDSGIEGDKDVEFVAPDDTVAAQIVEQVEFYFSDAHILKDAFLLKHARRNRDGYISLKLITSFKKVKKKTNLN